jgi:hypothetical protein
VSHIFDDTWHFIAINKGTYGNNPAMQIYVDGYTQTTNSDYKRCMGRTDKLPRVQLLANRTVRVGDTAMEAVRDGGVAFVGHLAAGIYNFAMHQGHLEHQKIIALGSPPMKEGTVNEAQNRAAAAIFLIIAFVVFVWSFVSLAIEAKDCLPNTARIEAKERWQAAQGARGVAIAVSSTAAVPSAAVAGAVAVPTTVAPGTVEDEQQKAGLASTVAVVPVGNDGQRAGLPNSVAPLGQEQKSGGAEGASVEAADANADPEAEQH